MSGMLQGLAAMRQRQEEIGEAVSSTGIQRLFLKDGETAKVRFLTDFENDVVSGDFHIAQQYSKAGRPFWRTYACTRGAGQCEWCENGNTPTFRFGMWTWVNYILHVNRVTDDDEAILVGGKTMFKEAVDAPMLFTQGWRVSCALVAFFEKRGTLNDRHYDITRTGAGLNTIYTFDPDDPVKFDKAVPELPPIWESILDEVDKGDDKKQSPKEKVSKAQTAAVSNLGDVNTLLAQLNVSLFEDDDADMPY